MLQNMFSEDSPALLMHNADDVLCSNRAVHGLLPWPPSIYRMSRSAMLQEGPCSICRRPWHGHPERSRAKQRHGQQVKVQEHTSISRM